jgi:PAS domain S-box-containing protein
MPAVPKHIRALRRKAEKSLSEAPDTTALTPARDLHALVHELSVHQIELEMQNDELRRSQEQLEESRSEYAKLYDFVPVGYLTFDKMGLVTRANLTACSLLGTERSVLIKAPFTLFVHPEARDLFYFHTQKVLKTKTSQICQLLLKSKKAGEEFFYAQLESIAAQSGGNVIIRAVITDITDRRKVEKALETAREELEKKVEERSADLIRMNDLLHQEIEEHKRTEQALRESERRERQRAEELATLLEAVPMPVIIVHDPDSTHMTGNRAADELLRQPHGAEVSLSAPPETKPRNFRAIKDGRELMPHELPAQRAAHGVHVRDFEFSLVFDDGTTRHLLGSGTPLLDDTGRPRGAVHVLIDITDRKRAEEAVQTTLQRFYTALSSMYTGLLLVTDDNRVEFANQAICDYFDLDDRPADLVGLASADILARIRNAYQCPDEAIARIMEIVDRGQPVRGEEVAMRGERELLRDFIPLYVNGQSHGRLWLHTDITDRKRAEEALRRAHDELEKRVQDRTAELQRAYDKRIEETRERAQLEHQLRHAQKIEALGTFTGGIAHDFNNILSAMIGFAELARDKLKEGSRERHHLQRVFEAGLRGRALIKQMLTFSRKTEQEKRPIQLSRVVEETMKLMRSSIPTTVSIRPDIRSKWGLVFADPTQMEQILMNLCTNAAHAMQERGGVLHVELSDFSVSESGGDPHGIKPGLYLKLSVRDTGTGMSPDVAEKIFDPFFTTKKQGEGTGLGLSVVHGIVTQHNGYIAVESEPGRGSAFTVYLPRLAEDPSHGTVGFAKHIPTGSERILFVDDEEVLVEMGREMLEELGYHVTAKTSSAEAIALFRSDPSKFDLLITDQTMPEMTGVDLAREVLAINSHMPVIICTGFSNLVDDDKARNTGIKAFAMKPLTKREIAKTIRGVLDG